MVPTHHEPVMQVPYATEMSDVATPIEGYALHVVKPKNDEPAGKVILNRL
jgi:hypothetical protein